MKKVIPETVVQKAFNNGFVNQIETQPKSCQYPLINYLDWSDLKSGQQNRVICRVKKHPSTPKWQEITGFVYDETDLQFRTN